MKKQKKQDKTKQRKGKINRRRTHRQHLDSTLAELVGVVGGLQVATESLIRALVDKDVITLEEFHTAVNDFNKTMNGVKKDIEAAGKPEEPPVDPDMPPKGEAVEVVDLEDPIEPQAETKDMIDVEKDGS